MGIPKLPTSKSQSNRALIIRALSGGLVKISGLSEAKDTRILQSLLENDSLTYDAGEAGTALRFMTSHLAISNRKAVLTGSDRMKKRPIGILVNALQSLGANIEYLENVGFPPLKFNGFSPGNSPEIWIDPSVSSQFLSSLVLVAPVLPNGLTINFKEHLVSSKPYFEMTLKMMSQAGIAMSVQPGKVMIPHQKYQNAVFEIESDWSSASYWFAIVACLKEADIQLNKLQMNSLQGDSAIVEIIKHWKVSVEYSELGIRISRHGTEKDWPSFFDFDFTNTPDLAQTLIVLCIMTGTEAHFSGLKSLALKETNRLAAMKSELKKVGVEIEIDEFKGTCMIPPNQVFSPDGQPFETHNDHRMAMALSILSIRVPIELKNPEVVEKSYPLFWSQLKINGFCLEQI